MSQVAKIRNTMALQCINAVEIVIGYRDPYYGQTGPNVAASFVCVACEAHMLWSNGIFECVDCGFELSSIEAAGVCKIHTAELARLTYAITGEVGFLTRVWRFLSRRR